MVDAIIFDLDGTIIDSEPLWLEAGMEVLKEEGLALTPKDMEPTEGLNTKDSVSMFYPRLKKSINSFEEITQRIDNRALEMICSRGVLQPGVLEAIHFLKENKVPLALASSTVERLIKAILLHFRLEGFFDAICSAETEPFGKPHPGIYITAAQKLNAQTDKCIAIEDSLNGMISVKAARMKLIAYLPDGRSQHTKYDFADLKLESFHNFGSLVSEYLQTTE
jgi:sugar-phosphatase